ncbi:MAG TPA: MFS transporter [Rhizomicrobium sp.]
MTDRLGRRLLLLGTAIEFALGAVGAALAPDTVWLIAARVVAGAAIGIVSFVSPLYISEIAPVEVRGKLVAINQVAVASGTMLRAAGMSSASVAILASVGVGIVNVLLTLVAMQLIDRVWRRPLLLVSLAGMALSLFLLGLAFSLPQLSGSLGWFAVASLMIYVGSFAVGLGPVFWLILSEIYPLLFPKIFPVNFGRKFRRNPSKAHVYSMRR